ncbi:MAG: hypothetical protein JW991_03615 [Candidatus Pacebacteria bacterium]|nr:hypothetical protein [Candidatus Paceibacterota bacterium]
MGLLTFLISSAVLAQGIVNEALPVLGSGDGVEILGKIISITVTTLLIIGFLSAFLYLVMGTYHWMSAGGDKALLAQAKDKIAQALLGLFILFSLFAIIKAIGAIFGINLIQIKLPTVSS